MLEQISALTVAGIAVLATAGMLIGFSKTSFGGLGSVSVALVALSMNARESTAFVLLLLLVGDVIALSLYHRDVAWRVLLTLLPSVLPGLLLGAWFINLVDDVTMRRSIGGILLAMVLLRLVQARRASPPSQHPVFTVGAGVAAGFTTMTANSAAPVMSLYFLSKGYDKTRFVSTNAWFFAMVNLCKVPLTASLGLFTPKVLWLGLAFAPGVALGAVLGRLVIRRISQRHFEWGVSAVTLVACVLLLVR